SMYHLFYGDQNGTPGSELTFFEMPMAAHTRRGTNAITRIGLFVRGESSYRTGRKDLMNTAWNIVRQQITAEENRCFLKTVTDCGWHCRQQIMMKSANSR